MCNLFTSFGKEQLLIHEEYSYLIIKCFPEIYYCELFVNL